MKNNQTNNKTPYYITYYHTNKDGENGYGSMEFHSDRTIKSLEDVRAIQDIIIKEDKDIDDALILNWREF